MFWGLNILDIIIVLIYFLAIFYIGFRAMKNIRSQADYFMGGRTFGKVMTTFTMFGQATSSESATGAATIVKQMGIAGIMMGIFPNFFQLPVLFFSAKWYRRLRLLAFSEFFKDRYKSRSLAVVYSISQAAFFVLVLGIGLMAMTKTVQALAPKPVEKLTIEQRMEYDQAVRREVLEQRDFSTLVSAEQVELKALRLLNPSKHFSYFGKFTLVFGMALIVSIYSICGGLVAAVRTDVLQSIATLMLTVLLVPLGLAKINSMHGSSGFLGAFRSIHNVLPESVFELFGSPANAEMTWYLMLAMSLTIVNTLCQANQMVAAGAARDDKVAREGFINGILVKRFATVLWGVTGMIILTIYSGDMGDPDLLWGTASLDLLGGLNMGLVGLMIACLLSAMMSTANTHMITVAALLTESVYHPLVQGKSEGHYVLVGRIFSALYMAGGVVVGLAASDLWTLMKYMLTFNFLFAAPFLMGMLWRRANNKAAWATVIVTSLVSVFLPLLAGFSPLREHEALLAMNRSVELTRNYRASRFDVMDRENAIARWKELHAEGKAGEGCPPSLQEGDVFAKAFASRERSIFWDSIKAEKAADGSLSKRGEGLLRVEMVILSLVGVPLEKLSYPMLETLRFLMKFALSFLPFLLVAKMTCPMAKNHLDLFYGKLRTPAVADPVQDAAEMELTRINPNRFNHLKLFPRSNFEFNKWDEYEVKGIVRIMAWVCLIFALLVAVTKLGA